MNIPFNLILLFILFFFTFRGTYYMIMEFQNNPKFYHFPSGKYTIPIEKWGLIFFLFQKEIQFQFGDEIICTLFIANKSFLIVWIFFSPKKVRV